jgi:hypothetical protein
MNIRCVLGAMQSLCSNQRNLNILKRILPRFRQWFNKSDQPKYLSGKGRLK